MATAHECMEIVPECIAIAPECMGMKGRHSDCDDPLNCTRVPSGRGGRRGKGRGGGGACLR
jgi:hypothetical protein